MLRAEVSPIRQSNHVIIPDAYIIDQGKEDHTKKEITEIEELGLPKDFPVAKKESIFEERASVIIIEL